MDGNCSLKHTRHQEDAEDWPSLNLDLVEAGEKVAQQHARFAQGKDCVLQWSFLLLALVAPFDLAPAHYTCFRTTAIPWTVVFLFEQLNTFNLFFHSTAIFNIIVIWSPDFFQNYPRWNIWGATDSLQFNKCWLQVWFFTERNQFQKLKMEGSWMSCLQGHCHMHFQGQDKSLGWEVGCVHD